MSTLATSSDKGTDPDPSRPRPPTHILETCLYVKSMDDAVAFYRNILGLTPAVLSPRLTMFPLGTTSLILFQLGATREDTISAAKGSGKELTVPGHGPDQVVLQCLMLDKELDAMKLESAGKQEGGAKLRTHYCLAVPTPAEVLAWESYLRECGVKMRGVMEWERGGQSVYFEDVDGHVGEIGSRGIWEHY